jgi:uncharacterized membrane protein YhaH (DUF805 family)
MSFVSLLFSLEGRIGRAKYWLGQLVLFVVLFVSWLVLLSGLASESIVLLLIPIALFPFSLWMSICIAGKRYHDRGKSAWWILICLIPIVGGIWQFIELGLLRGDDGTNDYGPDPVFSFNVAGDIEALRGQSGQGKASLMNRPVAVAAVAAPAPARAQPRSPYTDGRPVFGKRV